jgi:hypothetical protein
MIRLNSQVFESLLDRDSNGAAATPESDQKIGAEPGFADNGSELKGVAK